MRSKSLVLAASEALLACMALSALFVLGLQGIDPIVWIADASAEFSQHGKPTFSWVGAAAWTALVALYAFLAAVTAGRILSMPRRRCLVIGAPLLLLSTLLMIAVVHPTFLLTVLSPAIRSAYSRFIQDHIPVLDQIYFHWGLARFKYLVLLAQIVLALAVFGALSITSGRGKSSR